MGLLNNLLGNATELNKNEITKEFDEILCPGEEIEKAFNIIRDKWVFTTHRLIIEDIQGVTGRKREYHSIPYRSITHFPNRDSREPRLRLRNEDMDYRNARAF